MPFRTVRVVLLSFTMFALVALGTLILQPGSSHVTAAEANDVKIKALRKERLAALESIAEITRLFYGNGRISFSEVAEANRAVRNAQLELCETDADRVMILEKMLTEAQEFEKFTKGQKQAAVVTEVTVLKARAERLAVEIALEKAKAG